MGFGEYLKDYLKFNNISQSEFALRLNITQKHMNEILNGKTDISLDIALAIQKLTDIPVEFIVKSEYRRKIENYLYLKFTEKELKEILKKRFFIKELEEIGWIKFNDITNLVQNYIDIFDFLNVRGFEALDKVNEKILFNKDKTNIDKLSLWIARCDSLAKDQNVKEYNRLDFNFIIEDLKKLFSNNIYDIEKIKSLLNSYGIYLVVEETLKGTNINGSFKVRLNNPAIYIDKKLLGKEEFYYELFHELGHCKSDYNEAKNKVIVESIEMKEKRVNEFVKNIISAEKINIKDIGIRLREAREYLDLSQEMVAKILNEPETMIIDIENGNREITDNELSKFSKLYGFEENELLSGCLSYEELNIIKEKLSTLSKHDKKEIINLLKFKRKL